MIIVMIEFIAGSGTCHAMTAAWFGEKREVIQMAANETFAQDNLDWHWLNAGERANMYTGLVDAYKEAVVTRTMFVRVKAPCCNGTCGGIVYQRELLVAMRHQARCTVRETHPGG